MTITKLSNQIDPQVLADMISAELPAKMKFAGLAEVDTTLEGQPGSTITVPKFKYIGAAEDVAEGAAIDMTLLETDSENFTIKKAAKGVQITDEAMLSGYGDPVGEAGNQLVMAIADKLDDDIIKAAQTTKLNFKATKWDVDTVSDALDLFNDEDDEFKVLVLSPKDASQLRKAVAQDWERPSDLGDNIVSTGVYGGVLGAQVMRSRKLKEGEGFLVKPGGLKIYSKRKAQVEADRDIVNKTTIITADQHYGAHLYNEAKVVKITVAAATK